MSTMIEPKLAVLELKKKTVLHKIHVLSLIILIKFYSVFIKNDLTLVMQFKITNCRPYFHYKTFTYAGKHQSDSRRSHGAERSRLCTDYSWYLEYYPGSSGTHPHPQSCRECLATVSAGQSSHCTHTALCGRNSYMLKNEKTKTLWADENNFGY